MTGAKFAAAVAALLFGTVVLIWVVVSLAAVVFALTRGDGGAAGLYAGFVAGGVAVGAVAWWLGLRVARAWSARQ